MKPFVTLTAAALLLTACEDGTPEQNVTQVVAANSYSDQLKALSPDTRNLGLYRSIRDNNQRCKKVDRAQYQQRYKSMAMWTAHCTDSGDWAVYIAPNGDVQVSACRYAGQLGLPECRATATAPAAR